MINLNSVINELHGVEPYWSICRPCQCAGQCCVGADISITESEWQQIRKYVENMAIDDKAILEQNILNHVFCIFRAPTKCLIHDVRPENCKYTPYQALFNHKGMLVYSQVQVNPETHRCEFKLVSIPATTEQLVALQNNKFVDLPNYGTMTKYISLNWLVAHSQTFSPTHECSEWLKLDPLTL